MSIIDQLLSVLAPYECLSCEAEGNLLCTACIQQLTVIPEHCYRCGVPSLGALTCTDCGRTSDLYSARSGTAYSGAAKQLVRRLKFGGAQAAARLMAARLLPMLDTGSELLLVPVPTATDRVRGRGYDQARLLARELSRQSRLPYLDCLARSGHTHQVGASRLQRLKQLNGAFRVTEPEKVRGAYLILIDDVLTTGATMEAAAGLLKTNGAGRVAAMVFAQA